MEDDYIVSKARHSINVLPRWHVKKRNCKKHFLGEFTISEIEKACPDISRPTIYRVLKELKEKGYIKPIEVGRNAKWKKENISSFE